jgi:DNA polymerase
METFYDKDYSLRKIPTSLYVKDARFKVHTCAFKKDDGPVEVRVGDDEIKSYLAQIDWDDTSVLAHHTQFDGLILAHHYGIIPNYYLDTLSMARAKFGSRSSSALDHITQFLGMAHKSDDVEFAKGIHELEGDALNRMVEYNANDVEITYALFQRLLPFPSAELDLIDLTVRMFTQPGFEIDVPRAQAEYEKEVGLKAAQMLQAGLTKDTLGSSEKFAAWLRNQGIVPPMKMSAKQNKAVYAFAKTDLEFTALLEHENEVVRFGVEARLGAKSTGNESRAKRFVDEGSLGPLPVYLSYYGAHTGRWSGGNKINLQNLKRGGELRKCLIAPRGFVIGVADSGQIECRVNAWLSGQTDLLDRFKQYDAGDKSFDPYRRMASAAYGIDVDDVDSIKRFIGKIAVLGLGFQMGAAKYQATLASGAMGPKVDIDINNAYQIVNMYRTNNPFIVDMWARCEGMLNEMNRNVQGEYKCIKWKGQRVFLPNGMYLDYPDLDIETDPRTGRDHKTFKVQGVPRGIYGGLMLENIVQALARIIVSTQMTEISKRYKVLTMTHDEIVCLIPEDEADAGFQYMYECMTTPPDWCADLPLQAEGGWAREYSK